MPDFSVLLGGGSGPAVRVLAPNTAGRRYLRLAAVRE